MIHQKIHSTGLDQAMAQPHNDHGIIDDEFLDYILEELIELPDTSFHRPGSVVPATEASMRFSTVLPMGGSAIASSSQPIPCSNSKNDSNDIANITKITSVENTQLVEESMIVQGAMLVRGHEWHQWSDLRYCFSAMLF